MRILIIGPIPPPMNGCSYANFILCKNLFKEGYKYNTINTSTNIISSKQGNSFSFIKAFSFLRIYFSAFKVINATIVYFTPGQTFFGILKYAPFIVFCILFRKPYVIHIHGNYLGTQFKELKGIKKYFFKYLISNASVGIVLSESLKSNFEGLLDFSKIVVVENFVEDGIYASMNEITKPNDKLRIVYLSNLMKEKGILELLDALIKLKERDIDFESQIAGAIEQDIEKEVNQKLFILKSNVQYLGIVQGEKKHKILKESNVFILPTYYKMEGQPISILEALATGNIIITSPQGGIPDVVTEQNGYFVKSESAFSIAECIEKIGDNIVQQIDFFSNHNIEYAKRNFTEKMFTDKIIAVFEGLYNNKY